MKLHYAVDELTKHVEQCVMITACQFQLIVFVLTAFLISVEMQAQPTSLLTVTFDSEPKVNRGDGIRVKSYSENGFTFAPVEVEGAFTRAGGGVAGFPDNGTAFLLFGFGSSLSATRSGEPFSLFSVDLSEFSILYDSPSTVEVTGYKVDDSLVHASFLLDGIIDGLGPIPDFQTFYFDSTFDDITRVEFPGYGYALDNLIFYPVPEPGSIALTVLGALLLILRGVVLQRKGSP